MSTDVARYESGPIIAVSHERSYKREWQRNMRRAFMREHGYSTAAHYATGGQRERILVRDGRACVRCGMTDAEHKAKWERPITIDHIDKDRQHNTDDNLQTLCLACHGEKDLLPSLRVQRVVAHKETILAMRAEGFPYQAIADRIGFSIAAVWKWERLWAKESA